MSKPVAKELDEEEALGEAIDALRADNGRLLRLLIAGFVSDGRPEHKELTEVLAHHPNLRNWLGTGDLRILEASENASKAAGDGGCLEVRFRQYARYAAIVLTLAGNGSSPRLLHQAVKSAASD